MPKNRDLWGDIFFWVPAYCSKQVTGDKGQVTGDRWQVTGDRWEEIYIFSKNVLILFLYWCYCPTKSKGLVSPVWVMFLQWYVTILFIFAKSVWTTVLHSIVCSRVWNVLVIFVCIVWPFCNQYILKTFRPFLLYMR